MANVKNVFVFVFHNYLDGSFYTIFWTSIIVYSLGFLTYVFDQIISQLSILLMLFGLVGIGVSFLKLVKLNILNNYLRIVFTLFMLWQIYIIIRGIQVFDFKMVLSVLFSPYYFLHYFVPLIILIPANIFFAKKTFNFFTGLCILFFIVFLTLTNDLLRTNLSFSEQAVWTLGTGGGFLLLTWGYHNKKRKVIALLTVLLSLFISTMMARRNIMLTFSNFMIFSLLIVLLSKSQSVKSKVYILTFVFILTAIGFSIFLNYQGKMFGKISDHLVENTRDIVFNAFFKDMSIKDWIIGRGFLGEYYCPGAEVGKDTRFIIESGYLQTILKGGIISLGLFLLIAIPAAYLGIVKSKNILCKASGTIVILWLIDMFPWGMPAINIRYILVWTCIGICYSKAIRNLSESEIRNSYLLLTR